MWLVCVSISTIACSCGHTHKKKYHEITSSRLDHFDRVRVASVLHWVLCVCVHVWCFQWKINNISLHIFRTYSQSSSVRVPFPNILLTCITNGSKLKMFLSLALLYFFFFAAQQNVVVVFLLFLHSQKTPTITKLMNIQLGILGYAFCMTINEWARATARPPVCSFIRLCLQPSFEIVIKCKTWKMLRNEWNGTQK